MGGASIRTMLAENLFSRSLSKSVCLAILASLFAFCPAAFSQTAPVHGKWQRQIWNGIGGTCVSDLTSSPRFNQAPNSQTLTDYSYTQLGKNYYGARSRGYITPTATGLYTFWVAGDDEAQWFVSSTTSRSDAHMISSTSAATPVDGWDQSDSQHSKSQFMEAGKSYYVELLHKQATGSDHASVAWSMQGVDAGALQNWATTANGATASQSSNFDPVNSHPASNVIDGNESTYNYTSSAAGTWRQVDLGQDRPISSVELYNRQDSQSRLSDFRLSILNAQNHVWRRRIFMSCLAQSVFLKPGICQRSSQAAA